VIGQPSDNPFSLAGKVAWVIGGGGLLGTAVCRGLAAQGATVVVSDLRQAPGDAAADGVRAAGGVAHAWPVDIGDEAQVTAMGARIERELGGLDVMVNMTYRHMAGAWDQATSAEMDACMHVGLTGSLVASRVAAGAMVKRGGGSIVHFSSMYGVVSPDPRMYPAGRPVNSLGYGVAKAGLLQMVRYLAVMLAPQKVRVNGVVPGPFPLPDGQQTDREFMDRLVGKVPMGRFGRPEEMIGPVVFLASEASSFVTGSAVTVDGGWTAW
jgi:NAD(P)-dependent dehydrogenase (short-subunit alcohol dehydrogenase family)